MPEAAEVEIVRRTIAPRILRQRFERPFTSGLPLRNRVIPKAAFTACTKSPVAEVGRHGKLLWIGLESGAGLMVHLGMTGRLLVGPRAEKRPLHTHLELRLAGTDDAVRYVDPRRFGQVIPFSHPDALTAARAKLGPDPTELDDAEVAAVLARALRRRKRALKDLLLDQGLFAGVGNIYACEALFRARLSPFRRGSGLSQAEALALVEAAHAAVAQGIADGGTTLSDFVDAYGRKGGHQQSLLVFGREGEACPSCGTPIQRAPQGGRSTFYCHPCQRSAARGKTLRR